MVRLSELNVAVVREAETIVSNAQALSNRVHVWVSELTKTHSLTDRQIRVYLSELRGFISELAQLHSKIANVKEFDALTCQILGEINESLKILSLS